jgi:hypothetical protein
MPGIKKGTQCGVAEEFQTGIRKHSQQADAKDTALARTVAVGLEEWKTRKIQRK